MQLPTVQVTELLDQRFPHTMQIAFNIQTWVPFFHPMTSDQLVCDGIPLVYSAPAPYQSFDGFAGHIPLSSAKSVIQCSFMDLNGTHRLDVPVAPFPSGFTVDISSGVAISLQSVLNLHFQTDARTQDFSVEAWDDDHHLALPLESSVDAQGRGYAHFSTFQTSGLQPGSGTIFIADQLFTSTQASEWDGGNVSIILLSGISIPVTWTD